MVICKGRDSSSFSHKAVAFSGLAGVNCLSMVSAKAVKYEKWQMRRARRNHFHLLPLQTLSCNKLILVQERADNFPCLENGASH